MKNQGAGRHALAVRGHDFYETPEICIRRAHEENVLLNAGLVPGISARIWEPCAGRGAISRVLSGFGYNVVAHDLVAWPGADPGIQTPIDFLMERCAPAGAKAIVTNPPYKLADQFIRHGLSLVPHVIVFLRFMAVEGIGRSDLIDRHCREIVVGADRPPAMHREGWGGAKLSTSAAPFAWFRFHSEARPSAPIALRRIRWRAN